MDSLPVLIVISLALGQAADRPALNEAALAAKLEPIYQRQAAAYEFQLASDDKTNAPFQLAEQPAMRWTATGNSGAVYIWTENNLPAMVGCLGAFVANSGDVEAFHEFHLLKEEPILPVAIGSRYRWQPRTGCVPANPVSDAKTPAETDKLRLIQMRQLARMFEAGMITDNGSTVLRLSPTPLFRYSNPAAGIIDGAIFGYLWDVGTDPEVLLIIEAAGNSQTSSWQYRPIRFTWREVYLAREGQELWRVPMHNESRQSVLLQDSYVTCGLGSLASLISEATPPDDSSLPNP
jgi:hypothetical protein